MKITKASLSTQSRVKALIMGESGAGKSHLSATAPKPLIVLTEPNGAMSVSNSNPDALIVHVNNLTDFYNLLLLLENDEIKEDYETLIIDSLTELQRFFSDYIMKDNTHMTLQDYGQLGTQFSRVIRRVIALPKHVLFTSLIQVELEEEKTRHMYPLLTGKLRYTVQQYFTGVGYLYQTGETDESGSAQRALLLDGHDRIKTKAFPNTNGTIKDPNLTDLFEQVCQFTNPKPKRKRAPRKAKLQQANEQMHGPSEPFFGGDQ